MCDDSLMERELARTDASPARTRPRSMCVAAPRETKLIIIHVRCVVQIVKYEHETIDAHARECLFVFCVRARWERSVPSDTGGDACAVWPRAAVGRSCSSAEAGCVVCLSVWRHGVPYCY